MEDAEENEPKSDPDPDQKKPDGWQEIEKRIRQRKKIPVKPYMLKELAQVYKVSVPTFKKMLKKYFYKIGKPELGRYYGIAQVKQIFSSIDQPSCFTLTDLAQIYCVSPPTFKGWLNDMKGLGEKEGHYFSLRQLYVIVSHLDIPNMDGEKKEKYIAMLRFFA